jgi:hypothetical protein
METHAWRREDYLDSMFIGNEQLVDKCYRWL